MELFAAERHRDLVDHDDAAGRPDVPDGLRLELRDGDRRASRQGRPGLRLAPLAGPEPRRLTSLDRGPELHVLAEAASAPSRSSGRRCPSSSRRRRTPVEPPVPRHQCSRKAHPHPAASNTLRHPRNRRHHPASPLPAGGEGQGEGGARPHPRTSSTPKSPRPADPATTGSDQPRVPRPRSASAKSAAAPRSPAGRTASPASA